MKIAWASNAPWAATGYGQQTAQVVRRLRDAGHDVACISNYGLQGAIQEWEGVRVYPMGKDFSNDTIPAHALHWFDGDDGLLIILYDMWTIRSMAFTEMNVAAWVPIDHTPCPRLVAQHFAEYGTRPIAMSKFGEEQLAAEGFDPLYVPHGIDTTVFKPYDGAKAAFGLDEDRFLVGMVSTNNSVNPSRKSYGEAFAAFAALVRKHPDALLYVHAEHKGNMGGMDLRVAAQGAGLRPENVAFVDEYRYRTGLISPEELAVAYSAFDVLLFPSMGEGFGIPAVEAQACGTPVIVSNFSAQAELAGAGYKIGAQPWWDAAQAAYFCTPLVEELAAALEHAYENRDLLAGVKDECRAFAVQYDADRVFDEYWRPVLDELVPSNMPIVSTPVA